MRLDNFDLNLLIALDILLQEQSVTRAAERLHITQSAMSAALSRLRVALGDELLIVHGRKMIPTAHARALAPMVTEEILRLRGLISGAAAFDPATSRRRFEIAGSDYITTVLIAPLLRKLRREAPHIQLNLHLPNAETPSMLNDGKLDFMLVPEGFINVDHPHELLFEERHVVVGWEQNPVFASELTIDTYYSCGHVAVKIAGASAFIERHLEAAHDERRIEIVAPSFSVVPWLLPETMHLALMHERLARTFLPLLPLKIVKPPFEVPAMREMIQYHAARAGDQGLQWLLKRLLRAAHGHH